MTERIRKLAKLYEENSYQIMKEDFEEQWKTASDWSKEERIAVAFLFVPSLLGVGVALVLSESTACAFLGLRFWRIDSVHHLVEYSSEAEPDKCPQRSTTGES